MKKFSGMAAAAARLKPRGNRQTVARVCPAELRVSSARGQCANFVSNFPSGHFLAKSGNATRHLQTKYRRGPRRRWILSRTLEKIRTIDPGKMDLDQHLARADRRDGPSVTRNTSGPPPSPWLIYRIVMGIMTIALGFSLHTADHVRSPNSARNRA